MSQQERDPELEIRRILVALDASPQSRAALRTAAEVAARLQAELLGLFIEDVNLLRVAQLPLAREIDFLAVGSRRLDSRYVERQLKAQARQARQALARVADRSGVSWSFRVVRGAITQELIAAAEEADLITLGRRGWSRMTRRRLGSTARAVIMEANRLTLIIESGVTLQVPALVIYDGSDLSHKALAAAAHVTRGRNATLVVILVGKGLPGAQQLQSKVSRWLEERGIQASYRWMERVTVQNLSQVIEQAGCGLLVLPAAGEWLREGKLGQLFEEVGCPMLWVR